LRGTWVRSSRVYLVASAGLAVLSAVALHGYLSRVEAASAGPDAPEAVVVAARPISRGEPVGPSKLRVATIPRAYAPPGALGRIAQAAGRVALTDLAPGEVVTETRLARVRAGPVASLVPQGLRAFAVPTSLPSGAVAAGDHIDVLATFNAGQPHSEVVVSGVEILYVLGPPGVGGAPIAQDVGLDLSPDGGNSITLIVLVSPDQEERLAFARAFADLEVAIAPPADTDG
jgi:Flp pilus assembly protein CpaB